MLVIVRPAAIGLATLLSGLTWQERAITGWIAPRGIVAASRRGRCRVAASGGRGAWRQPHHARRLRPDHRQRPSSTAFARTLGERAESPPRIEAGPRHRRRLGLDDRPRRLPAQGRHQHPARRYLSGRPEGRRAPSACPSCRRELLSEHGEEALESRAIDWVLAGTPNDMYNGLVCARSARSLGGAGVPDRTGRRARSAPLGQPRLAGKGAWRAAMGSRRALHPIRGGDGASRP